MVFHELELATRADLRERAEASISNGTQFDLGMGSCDAPKLLHELQVCEVELRMQNQSLIDALHEAEVYRAKFQELYEAAPLAYIGVRQSGKIVRLNRRAVTLLGGPAGQRSELVGQSITDFVAPASTQLLRTLLARTLSSGEVHSEQLEMRSHLVLPVYVEALAQAYCPVGSDELHARLMLTDVTALNMAKDDVVRHMMKLGD